MSLISQHDNHIEDFCTNASQKENHVAPQSTQKSPSIVCENMDPDPLHQMLRGKVTLPKWMASQNPGNRKRIHYSTVSLSLWVWIGPKNVFFPNWSTSNPSFQTSWWCGCSNDDTWSNLKWFLFGEIQERTVFGWPPHRYHGGAVRSIPGGKKKKTKLSTFFGRLES